MMGMPTRSSIHAALSQTIDIGCQKVGDVIARERENTEFKMKRLIFVTSSHVICNGVNQLFDWFKNGFPVTLPGGMSKQDYMFLHHNIKFLEDKGITVQFWRTERQFIIDATCLAWNRFLAIEDAPISEDPNECICSDCMVRKQAKEYEYARTGVACCPCPHSLDLIAKAGYLKKGEKFVLTNNAGVTEATVEMLVDAQGRTFRNPT